MPPVVEEAHDEAAGFRRRWQATLSSLRLKQPSRRRFLAQKPVQQG
jgi:hypothetical protein